jgi:hypothetical protein
MKLTYSNPTSRIQIEAEVPDAKTAFETVAEVQELFDEKACGACQSNDIRCDVRTAQGFRFYQLKCRGCSARLDFGQHQEGGTLFAKRRNDDGSMKPDNGWYVYQPEGSRSTSPTPPPVNPFDTALAAIAAAKDAGALHQIGEQIGQDIAAGRIPKTDKPALAKAWGQRLKEITGKAPTAGRDRSF